MKRGWAIIVLLAIAVSPALGQFKMPDNVHRMNELETAKAEARKSGRPIAFIYTKESSTCGLCARASLLAADELRRKTVVVYADSEKESGLLPKIVNTALGSEKAGRYIPKTVIVDSALENVLAIVPYASGEQMNELLREAGKALPRTTPPSPAPGGAPSPGNNKGADDALGVSRPMRVWTSRAGTKVKAAFVQEINPVVILKKEDGTTIRLITHDLSKQDQAYVQGLKKEHGD